MDWRYYHVAYIDTKMIGNDLKMKAKGFHASETCQLYSGIQEYYHINTDSNLGIGRVAVQGIPSGCTSCLDKLE